MRTKIIKLKLTAKFLTMFSKNIHKFVVRDLPIYFHYGANSITNKAETKTRGRRTVESTTVQLMLRMGESRSDLPSLFNFKSNVMRDSMDKKGLPSPMALNAIHNSAKPDVLQWLCSLTPQQLIAAYITEMDAKNRAYYFIIEKGHFSSFNNFCDLPKSRLTNFQFTNQ